MYGNSLLVAEEAEAILTSGHKATVYEDPELADWEKYKDKYILVVTSTTGQGDLPDSIVPLFGALKILATSRTFTTASSPGRQLLRQFLRRRQAVRRTPAGTERPARGRHAAD